MSRMAQEMQVTADGRLVEKAASAAAVAAAHASVPAPHAATPKPPLPPPNTAPPYAAVAASSGNTGPAVAGSGAPGSIDMGTVRKAMAWRVKYRMKSEKGQDKRRLPLQLLGVHPSNRGGVYPQGEVVKTLGIKLAGLGYNQEVADHQGVAVEQAPNEYYGEYNRRKCLGQPLLSSCFGVESNVAFGMLSHNHLLLLLLCWANSAKWELNEGARHIGKGLECRRAFGCGYRSCG